MSEAITHTEKQGSAEWLSLRQKFNTASEASAMMGVDKHTTRDELLALKAGGPAKEFSDYTKNVVFPRGHEVEALARPIAETVIGGELYPVVMSRNGLLASCDGIVMLEDVAWEHKQWSESLADSILNFGIPDSHIWQLVQICYVTDCEKILFTVSDGTDENLVNCWYDANADDRRKLLAGWEQFDKDVANYVHAAPAPKPVADSIDSLPALNIRITGEVAESNLAAYRDRAMQIISAINTNLITDQHFVDAEAAVKWCASAESKVESIKEQALCQTRSIDELFKAMDEIKETLRQKRLSLDKLVKTEKESRKREMIKAAEGNLCDEIHIANEALSPVRVNVCADFASAIKGKRTIESQQNQINTELARAKIEITCQAREITSRLEVIKNFEAYDFLFRDLQHLVSLEEDNLLLVATVRVEGYEQKEKARRVAKEAAEVAEKLRIETAMAAKLEAETPPSASLQYDSKISTVVSTIAQWAEPAAMTIQPSKLIIITYKNMKSGPKLLEIMDAEGNELSIEATGDGQIKTITIEV